MYCMQLADKPYDQEAGEFLFSPEVTRDLQAKMEYEASLAKVVSAAQ